MWHGLLWNGGIADPSLPSVLVSTSVLNCLCISVRNVIIIPLSPLHFAVGNDYAIPTPPWLIRSADAGLIDMIGVLTFRSAHMP